MLHKTRIEVHGLDKELIYAKSFWMDPEDEALLQSTLDELIPKFDHGFPSSEGAWAPLTPERIREIAIFPEVEDPYTVFDLFKDLPKASFLTFHLDVIRKIPGIQEDFIATGGGFDYLVLWKKLVPEPPEVYFVAVNDQSSRYRTDPSTNCWIYQRDPELEKQGKQEIAYEWDPKAIAFSLWNTINLISLGHKDYIMNQQKTLEGEDFWH